MIFIFILRFNFISIFTRTWLRYVPVFAIANPSFYLSVVCNVGAPYSGGWTFRQYFFTAVCPRHPLTSVQNFTEIVPGESQLGRTAAYIIRNQTKVYWIIFWNLSSCNRLLKSSESAWFGEFVVNSIQIAKFNGFWCADFQSSSCDAGINHAHHVIRLLQNYLLTYKFIEVTQLKKLKLAGYGFPESLFLVEIFSARRGTLWQIYIFPVRPKIS